MDALLRFVGLGRAGAAAPAAKVPKVPKVDIHDQNGVKRALDDCIAHVRATAGGSRRATVGARQRIAQEPHVSRST